MSKTWIRVLLGTFLFASLLGLGSRSRGAGAPDYIEGVVTSANGPEAGVWVIAETQDLPTQYAKVVVTDDNGKYVLPQLPTANYQVWVRGYGLVDSPAVLAKPGQTMDLKAVVAPDGRAAAQVYPANYWLGLLKDTRGQPHGRSNCSRGKGLPDLPSDRR